MFLKRFFVKYIGLYFKGISDRYVKISPYIILYLLPIKRTVRKGGFFIISNRGS